MKIEPVSSWQESDETQVTIRLTDSDEGTCTVTIEEVNIPGNRATEIEQYWSRRLELLRELVGRIRKRRKSVRQALLVIHGIGEQQPGETLGRLVESGILSSAETVGEGIWVKPDPASGSYELRRVTLEGSDDQPTTDAFEFYWAHIIRDTTLGQVGTWLRRLLLRWRVPRPLRPLWLLSWILLLTSIAAAAAIIMGAEWPARWFASGTILAVSATLVWRIVGKALALDLLGDAARYLMPHPANVAHRQTIRREGVDLIKRLHGSGLYDRIIVLGHSLGSVIAYDIITYAWAEMSATHRKPSAPSFTDIRAVELNIDVRNVESAQGIQHAAWRRTRANTQPWLITDLVTVGSPLAHADFLMAPSRKKFTQAKTDRTLPACPPEAEVERKSGHRRVTYDRAYRDPLDERTRTFTRFHHGAPFAVVRWTNLYFKARRFGTAGDLIGGPVAQHFGPWVKDVPLRSPTPFVAHTWYWRPPKSGTTEHLEALKTALHLDVRNELQAQVEEMPAFMFLNGSEVA